MRCVRARRRLSEWIDGDLRPADAGALAAHVVGCPSCARVASELRRVSSLVADLPRMESADPVAQAVLAGLEVETRGPGLRC